ncbi:uncharacterized protein LOC107196877 isoform X1 [Astyanax mexicanus]|uniref:uncharacterized protein LOC107196877 isoform X1 n=2 Tax=Astyanax mexicanus TaxID=7994 RepID=UPI0020CB41AB|nr:uncharacterized protein LOC107196877 isoform X1 [Astyanax mexicanus]
MWIMAVVHFNSTQYKKEKIPLSPLMQKRKGAKLFVPAGSSVQCSRGKVGKSLYQALPEFSLQPKLPPWSYHSLHYKHLRTFFKNPAKKKHLVDRGLITEDGQVLCSIREFNQYIDYLKTIDSEWDQALQKQETPEITRTIPSIQVTCIKTQPEKKEQHIKPGSKDQTQTLDSSVLTVEPDDDCVSILSPNLLQRSEELKLIDLEEEEQEESLQIEADVSVETSIKKKINFSGLMEKPIGTKLLVPEGCSMQYYRGKVGKSLYQSAPGFDLRDPHMQQNPWKYSCLHDKHLKKFFNKPGRRKQLIKQGLITEDGHVACSLKEFNQYADYQKYIKPKQQELLLPDVRVSLPPVEEVDTCTLRLEVTSPKSVTTEEPSKDDIPVGPKKIKDLAFFKKAWKAVKRAVTRRSPKISPDS